MEKDPVVIVGAKRTPMGGFQGELSGVTAPDLGTHAIKAALDDAGADAEAELVAGVQKLVKSWSPTSARAASPIRATPMPRSTK